MTDDEVFEAYFRKFAESVPLLYLNHLTLVETIKRARQAIEAGQRIDTEKMVSDALGDDPNGTYA